MRSIRLILPVLLAFAVRAARADEVVLDNGRVVVGTVVSDDDRSVKVEQNGGTITLERSRVREIRKKPLPAEPAARAPSPAPRKPGADTPKPQPGPAAAGDDSEFLDRPKATDAAVLVARMKEIRLEPWGDTGDGTFEVPIDVSAQWRIERTDGTIVHAVAAPRTREGIRGVWSIDPGLTETIRRAKDAVREQLGERVAAHKGVWWRAEWDEPSGAWLQGPRGRRLYQEQTGCAAMAITQLGVPDAGALGDARRKARAILCALDRDPAADVSKARAELVALCRRMSADDEGARVLARVHEIHGRIFHDPRPQNIPLARECCDLLVRFVAKHRP